MAQTNTFNTRIQHKHDVEANWLKATTFAPKAGELIIYDVDEIHSSPRFKVGDGTTLVTDLPFSSAQSSEVGKALLKTGDTMEGILKFTEGVHYGEEVPAEGEEGQIFFQLGERLADTLDDGSIGLSKLSEEIQNKINISEQLFTGTIAAADWTQHSGYADVSITVDGLNSSTSFDVDLNLPATGTMSVMRNQIMAWGSVMRVNTTADNTVRFLYDRTAPTVALPIKIRWRG